MTVRTNLTSLIPTRTTSPLAGSYSVAVIPGAGGHLIGRDDQGRACILLASLDSGVRPPIRLGGLAVQYALSCAVRFGKSDEARVLSVVTSTNNSADDERYFLHIMSALLELVGPAPSLDELAQAITELAGIFRQLSRSSRESITGITGELVLIACAADPVAVSTAWRTDPDDRYDFAAEGLRLEVKSTSRRQRLHDFSYEQADVPVACQGVVASIFIEQCAGGMSLEQLILCIASRLASYPAAIFRIEQILAGTLGSNLPSALNFAFDMDLALEKLSFFDLREVPAIRSLPPMLSQVRFTSDLSATPELDIAAVIASCSAMAAFVPTGDKIHS